MNVRIMRYYIGAQTNRNFLPGIKIENKDEYGNAEITISNVMSIQFYDESVRITYKCTEDGADYDKKFVTYFNKYDFYKIEIQ